MDKLDLTLDGLHEIIKKTNTLLNEKDEGSGTMGWHLCLGDRLKELKQWLDHAGV